MPAATTDCLAPGVIRLYMTQDLDTCNVVSILLFMRIPIHIIVFIVAVAHLSPLPTLASCAPLTLEEQIAQVDTIVLGTAAKIDANENATIEVEEVFKGNPANTITISGRQSPEAITSIDVTFEQNGRYIFFLLSQPDGTYTTNQCTGTRMVQTGLTNEERDTLGAIHETPASNAPSAVPTTLSGQPTLTSSRDALLNDPVVMAWFLAAMIWELLWKGFALWRAAQRRQKGWFIALLVLNTLGILPILYLLITRKRSAQDTPQA